MLLNAAICEKSTFVSRVMIFCMLDLSCCHDTSAKKVWKCAFYIPATTYRTQRRRVGCGGRRARHLLRSASFSSSAFCFSFSTSTSSFTSLLTCAANWQFALRPMVCLESCLRASSCQTAVPRELSPQQQEALPEKTRTGSPPALRAALPRSPPGALSQSCICNPL